MKGIECTECVVIFDDTNFIYFHGHVCPSLNVYEYGIIEHQISTKFEM